MQSKKIIYWVSTSLFSAAMLFSGYNYLFAPGIENAFAGLGFTEDYFRIELAIAKILGALVLILPFVPKSLKYFAYAGFAINLISAIIAHIAKDYNAYGFVVFSIVALASSYYSFTELGNSKKENNHLKPAVQ